MNQQITSVLWRCVLLYSLCLSGSAPSVKGVSVGNWVSYGFNKARLPAAVLAAKDKSRSIYAQIAADRVENIAFEDIDMFGSVNGGIRVSDMPGDVTLRDVRIIRKPGTRNLLSTISDALRLMNIRGRVIMEDCVVEAPGDDCLNIGAQRENIVELAASDRRIVTLRSTDNRYHYYTIREGDRLQFLDTASNKVLGVRTVTAAAFDRRKLTHTVTLEQEVPGLDPKTTQAMNLNQITKSTVIRHNTVTPYMRNALLARAQNMTIEGNRLDCSRGGVIGLNLSYASGQDDARLWNVRVAGNTFMCPDNVGLVAWRPYQDEDGGPDTRMVNEQRGVLCRIIVANTTSGPRKTALVLQVPGKLLVDGVGVANSTQRAGVVSVVRPSRWPEAVTAEKDVVNWRSTVELRQCVDFIYVGEALRDDLTTAQKTEMIAFVKRELLMRDWMRAMSLQDAAAARSDRPDHGPMGAFDGWVPLTVGAMWRLGDPEGALDFFRRTAVVTKEGPFAQAREFFGPNRKKYDAPVRVAERGGCMKECISGAAFADVVLNTFFGFNPSVDGGSLVSDPQTPRPFQGTLAGLRYRGQRYQLEASSQGVSLTKDQRAK